jgi:hypothetical protein
MPHAPSGIRTHDRSKLAAVDLRLRPRGHWDRQPENNSVNRFVSYTTNFLSFSVGYI